MRKPYSGHARVLACTSSNTFRWPSAGGGAPSPPLVLSNLLVELGLERGALAQHVPRGGSGGRRPGRSRSRSTWRRAVRGRVPRNVASHRATTATGSDGLRGGNAPARGGPPVRAAASTPARPTSAPGAARHSPEGEPRVQVTVSRLDRRASAQHQISALAAGVVVMRVLKSVTNRATNHPC